MSTGHPELTPRLIADIGGTNARFGLVEPDSLAPQPLITLPTRAFQDLGTLTEAALDAHEGPRPDSLACAVAGPIQGDEIRLLNAGWAFSVEATRQALGLSRLEVINDWEAQAWAIPALGACHLAPIQSGSAHQCTAPSLALGPGTGLGSALLVPTREDWQVFPTEGGHISFGPAGAREAEVVLAIQARFGHCSVERMASGTGLEAIHGALRQLDGDHSAPLDARQIADAAQAGDPVAEEAVDLLLNAIASATGDLALATGARGGVYLGGGLIPALGERFSATAFQARFQAKGRFRDWLAAIPVYRITHPQPALLGLSRYLQGRS